MISEVWKALLDYLKRTKLWPWIEPFLLVGFLYTGVVVASFQYIQWRYGVTLSLPRFLGSYVFWQVSVAFLALLASYFILIAPISIAGKSAEPSSFWRRFAGKRGSLMVKTSAIFLVLTVAAVLARSISPHSDVSSIRVMIAPAREFVPASQDGGPAGYAAPEVDISKHRGLLVYLLFELNRLQETWHFEMDLEPFKKTSDPAVADVCDQDDSPITCYAETFQPTTRASGMKRPPLIVITSGPLGLRANENLYWLHRERVSVITTHDWQEPNGPSVLDYLVYTLTLQAIITHFDMHCGRYAFTYAAGDEHGVKPRATQASDRKALVEKTDGGRIVEGNVFELANERDAFRAAILAGHLGFEDEQRLLNCFGPEYMRSASSLLRLEWLHSERVRDNLRKVYSVKDDLLPTQSPSK